MATGVAEPTIRRNGACRERSRHPQAPPVILSMKPNASEASIRAVARRAEALGLQAEPVFGTDRALIGVAGDLPVGVNEFLRAQPGVEDVRRVDSPCKYVSREAQPEGSTVRLGDFEFGSGRLGVIAGPCAVEGRDQILRMAEAVREAGAVALRGGAYKPRTSPYSFRGLAEEGLELLAEARERTGLPICTEVMHVTEVDRVAEFADMLQIGARNMQNFELLEAVGRTRRPVLLKRGLSAELDELLQAAEYIARMGNKAIVLCERGIRTFERFTRNTLSLCAVAHLKRVTHLPVIVDPSHGTGERELVEPASMGAVAVGADGLIVEVHPDPDRALVDGAQSINPEAFAQLMSKAARVRDAIGCGL